MTPEPGPQQESNETPTARELALRRTVGMFAHIQPWRCLSEELIADRRAEAEAEAD